MDAVAQVLFVQRGGRGIVYGLVELARDGARIGIVDRGVAEGRVGRLLCRAHDLLDLIQVVHIDPELDLSTESHPTSLVDADKAQPVGLSGVGRRLERAQTVAPVDKQAPRSTAAALSRWTSTGRLDPRGLGSADARFPRASDRPASVGGINKVKVIKRRAYGLPSFDRFRERVLLACA